MPRSLTRGVALSLVVCFVALLAAPALAAAPGHGQAGFTMPERSSVSTGLTGRGLQIFTSLEIMTIPVAGPLVALSWAGRALWRFLPRTSGSRPAGLLGNFSHGTGPWAMNRPSFPASSGFRGMGGVIGIGEAENLTSYLGGKGYGVADLDSVLSEARTALASSNMTAYIAAMRTFRKNLGARISAGTVNQSVIGDYLKTRPAANPLPGKQGIRGMGRGFLPRMYTNQTGQRHIPTGF